MDTLSMHVEYLLREHDCVVLPGFGAFICDNRPASFDCDGVNILPPGRRLAFNPLINRNDGLLATSIARRESIAFEAASKKVAERIAHLRGELQREQRMQFGRLGRFILNSEGITAFVPAALAGINGAFFGLKPIALKPLQEAEKTAKTEAGAEPNLRGDHRRRWRAVRAYASGIAAALAVAVTIGMFLLNPVRINKPTTEASLAPGMERTQPGPSLSAEAPESENTQAATPALSTQTPAEAIPTADTLISNPDKVAVKAATVKPVETAAERTVAAAKTSAARFDDTDKFCVIVASFATRAQADTYLAEHTGKHMGIIEKDNRFRVYAATGSNYEQAASQKPLIGNPDAWVCRR